MNKMDNKKKRILVSACLLGKNCKYNGGNNLVEEVLKLTNDSNYEVTPFCPEVLAGLSIPRKPVEYVDGHLIDKDGLTYDKELKTGQEKVKKLLEENHYDLAILKSRSPSCGANGIYDGTFTKTIVIKDGFAVEIIKRNGIKVLSELDYIKK